MTSNQSLIEVEDNINVDQVLTYSSEETSRDNRRALRETRYGALVTTLQQEYPASASIKRWRLLKTIERFDGDVERIRKFLQKHEEKNNDNQDNSNVSQHQRKDDLLQKYAAELVELESAGINIHSPLVLQQLEKFRGNVQKVLDVMKQREEKKDQINQLDSKFADQIAELERDGIKVKKSVLIKLLDQANGQVDVVKQLLAEKKQRRHEGKSSTGIFKEDDEQQSSSYSGHQISEDDLDHLRELRQAGVRGNPAKILRIFHQCNDSIEMTVAHLEKEREEQEHEHEKRTQKRILLAEIHDSYLSINDQNDWPDHIQQVYLDGNNMMFVIDSLRRLCLNRARNKTERALAEIASSWNAQMHIPNVELIFDSTRHLEQVEHIKVSSAQPAHKTTDDMLIDIAQRAGNQQKNEHTIIVTSDRALAAQLKREGCVLVKPYEWFAHCAMVLTPDLINREATANGIKAKHKIQCDLDELVRRIVKVEL